MPDGRGLYPSRRIPAVDLKKKMAFSAEFWGENSQGCPTAQRHLDPIPVVP